MAEIKDQEEKAPLLADGLTDVERVFLSQVVQHAGYRVIIKLLDAGCTKATQDIVRLNPERTDYDHVLKYRSQRSRSINEFSSLVLKSIDFHTKSIQLEVQEEQVSADAAVAKVFGIHKVPPKTKKVIGQKQEESPKGAAVNESK